MNLPDNCLFTPEHEWVRQEDDTAVVGITEHAQAQLGDVVFVDLPQVGRKLASGETFGTVESVKAVSDLFAPLSGEVVAVNGDLVESPEWVNSCPHTTAWMIKIKPSDAGEMDRLLPPAAYQKLLAST